MKDDAGPWLWSLAAAMLLAALAGPSFFGRVYTHDDLGCFHLRSDLTPSNWCGERRRLDALAVLRLRPDRRRTRRHLPTPGTGCSTAPCPFRRPGRASCWPTTPCVAGTYYFLRRWRMPRAGTAMFGSRRSLLGLQPAAAGPPECGGHYRPDSLAAMGHRPDPPPTHPQAVDGRSE